MLFSFKSKFTNILNYRSLCTVICKWLYDAAGSKWDKKFLINIGLEDLSEDNFLKIGK